MSSQSQQEKTLSNPVPPVYLPLYKPARYKTYWGGRGAGRSYQFSDALLLRALREPIKWLCAREIQKSIRDSVHTLLAKRINDLNIGYHFSVMDNEIRAANGGMFIYAGLWRNIESIKSAEDLDGVWIEEANTVSQDSWDKLIPTIRKPGSEIWSSFNPERKSDPIYQNHVLNDPPPGAVVRKVSWRDNPWFPQVLRDEMEDLKSKDYDKYRHVWEGELRTLAEGAIYGKQIRQMREDGRITSIPVLPNNDVHTFWDLGRNDNMAIWFMQRVGFENRFIDYYEHRLEDFDHYVRILREKDYLYGTHYLPHDGDAIVLGSNNRSRKQILEEAGVKPIEVVPRIPNLQEGIELTREFMAQCWIDEQRCERGLECLSQYEYKFSQTENAFTNNVGPKWATNGADAFRQAAQGFVPPQPRVKMEFKSAWG